MLIFDVGFYRGEDSQYYLARGHSVVAFEANPILYEAGRKKFEEFISDGRLILENCGVGKDSGTSIDFFLHIDSDEWSTFYKEAALGWGPGKSTVIQVPSITPREAFARYGVPDYVKTDIEGYDIFVAEELKHLKEKPKWASFEATSTALMRELMIAGYRSFKIVDQAEVPLQSVTDGLQNFSFGGGTGAFGDDAPGLWLSFENIMYLYFRYIHDPFAPSTRPGHWYDIHAGLREPDESNTQIAWMKQFVKKNQHHCGMMGQTHKPGCPYTLLRESLLSPTITE